MSKVRIGCFVVTFMSLALSATVGQDCVAWKERQVSGPSKRGHHAMAYDRARGVTVVHGGHVDPSGLNGETWEWDGTAWTEADEGPDMPSPREDHAMAYDEARGVTVLFGGWDGSYKGDTWEWNGLSWRLAATDGPSPRESHEMVYDSWRGVIVLFGGFDALGRNNETWEWNGTSWNRIQVVGSLPSARGEYGFAFDSRRGVAVLFGGHDGSPRVGDTWEWDGFAGTWMLRATTGPTPRSSQAMAYDTDRGVCVLIGGFDDQEYDGETWEWDGNAWTLKCDDDGQCNPRPTNRATHTMAYDKRRRTTLLFGGWNLSNGQGDTWEWFGDCNCNGIPDGDDVGNGTSADCNGNGVPDECDIADGTSQDGNGNGVPDECELGPDCNGNGISDEEDIRNGTSLDCNLNGIPDECEIGREVAYSFEGLNLPIFDYETTINSQEITQDFSIEDMEIGVRLTHTYLGDLTIDLRHEETGTIIRLWNRQCGSSDNMDVLFDDQGSDVICASPTNGTYRPFQALSGCTGESTAGTWTVIVSDHAVQDEGTLDAWSVHAVNNGAEDCDGDGVLDECEQDRDGNGTPDQCESCEHVIRFKTPVKFRSGRCRIRANILTDLPVGTPFTFCLDEGDCVDVQVDDHGRAKTLWSTLEAGSHDVCLSGQQGSCTCRAVTCQ